MDMLYVVLPLVYMVLAAGIFYTLFKAGRRGKEKKDRSNIRYITKKAVRYINLAAGRLGLIFYRHKAQKELTIRRRVLEILENEKDIQVTPPTLLGYKVIIAIILSASGILLGGSSLYRLLYALMGLAAGYFIPDILVYWYSKRITDDIEKELPYVIDLLRISSLSGQNIYNSFKIVSRKYNGRISASLKDFIRCIDMGMGKEYAYKNLMLTSRSGQFREFVSVLCEADRYGSSVEDILSGRSVQINNQNWDNAERKAKKKGLLTLLPLTCLILPAFVLLVGGPLVYSMAKGLLF